MFLQRDFDQVARMAVPAVFADYNRQFEGEARCRRRSAPAKTGASTSSACGWPPRAARQQRRSDGHLRQGRAPHRPQPARGHDAACGQRRLPVPAQGAGQGARPAGEPVRLRRHGVSVRPRDQHRRRRGPSHERRRSWLPWACSLDVAWRAPAPTAADPRLREVVYDPQAVVTVPVKRGVVTLVVLDPTRRSPRSPPAWAATAPRPKPPGASPRSPAAGTSSSSRRARPARRTTWPWSPTAARIRSASSCWPDGDQAAGVSARGKAPAPPQPPGRSRREPAPLAPCRRCRHRRRRRKWSPSACRPSRR